VAENEEALQIKIQNVLSIITKSECHRMSQIFCNIMNCVPSLGEILLCESSHSARAIGINEWRQ